MTKPILSDDQLEAIRDNHTDTCSGCGCVPRLEHDGLLHWWHERDCPVMARIREEHPRGIVNSSHSVQRHARGHSDS